MEGGTKWEGPRYFVEKLRIKFFKRFYRNNWKNLAKPMFGLRLYDSKYNWYKSEYVTCFAKTAKRKSKCDRQNTL